MPPSDPPQLILIIPEARLVQLPPALYALLQKCEALYCKGSYYVTVPAMLYREWQVQMEVA